MNDEITTKERKWHVDELRFTEKKKLINKKSFISNNEIADKTLIKHIWHVFNAIM